jgi:GNAT superfamily N-acetyltransferase
MTTTPRPERPAGDDGSLRVRPLTPSDLPSFLDLITALAEYEHLPPPDAAARERLIRDAQAKPPRFHALVAERRGRLVGYAVFFATYSTFLAKPTLYIEDLFVLPSERRTGVGRALVRALVREAIRWECGRIEWQVLTWNEPAIAFYESLGARRLDEWRTYRLTADQFAPLAFPAGLTK